MSDDQGDADSNDAGAYYNCTTQCPNCAKTCDQQTKADGTHPGHSHHCPTDGNYT